MRRDRESVFEVKSVLSSKKPVPTYRWGKACRRNLLQNSEPLLRTIFGLGKESERLGHGMHTDDPYRLYTQIRRVATSVGHGCLEHFPAIERERERERARACECECECVSESMIQF